MFITESGKVYACGWGADGQTGLGIYDNQSVPAQVKGDITSEKIVKVACTGDSVLALNGKSVNLLTLNLLYCEIEREKRKEIVFLIKSLISRYI